jgi:hypothetical protein
LCGVQAIQHCFEIQFAEAGSVAEVVTVGVMSDGLENANTVCRETNNDTLMQTTGNCDGPVLTNEMSLTPPSSNEVSIETYQTFLHHEVASHLL